MREENLSSQVLENKKASLPYGQFCAAVQEWVQEAFGSQAKVSLQKVRKNNNLILNGITAVLEGKDASPIVYLEPYYQDYLDGLPLNGIADSICAIFRQDRPGLSGMAGRFKDFQSVQDIIIYRLVNYNDNRELLGEIPHRRFLDLAVTYHCLLDRSPEGECTAKITKSLMESWQVDEEALYAAAHRNTHRISPSQCILISEMLGKPSLEMPLYVLTNTEKLNGAACILYDGALQGIWGKLGGDFYILPSSIHECILVPRDNNIEVEALRSMVCEVNRAKVGLPDRLSDNVYFYSSDGGGTLSICGDTGKIPSD